MQEMDSEIGSSMDLQVSSVTATDIRGKHRILVELKRLEQEEILRALIDWGLQKMFMCSDFVCWTLSRVLDALSVVSLLLCSMPMKTSSVDWLQRVGKLLLDGYSLGLPL
ncbi:hypothetical protein HHK36_003626 [Tetracentron sinense]|uniref:Uncharacterized protein n=1 Tax=Tetracentron sinense TaxID=13715 RepID=A0A834ZRG8_TETSI|nr:hypothetical protein HHK36_003626 [Tetracentron sinense]